LSSIHTCFDELQTRQRLQTALFARTCCKEIASLRSHPDVGAGHISKSILKN
jgi:hypothetical protein